ncbi:unnamed protein product [Colias eurytheme]|nr:unnamed protein product [Colias eurytheme]
MSFVTTFLLETRKLLATEKSRKNSSNKYNNNIILRLYIRSARDVASSTVQQTENNWTPTEDRSRENQSVHRALACTGCYAFVPLNPLTSHIFHFCAGLFRLQFSAARR